LSKKLTFFAFFLLAVLIISNVSLEGIGKNARRPAIVAGADRVVELQRADPGWEGTWYWYVSSTYNATNLTGVTALGLLEAFRDVKDSAYLDAAQEAANFIMTHLGAGAPGPIYHVRLTAPDIVFLYRLSEVTGDDSYATRASAEWAHMTVSYPTAGDLDNLFHAIARRSAWDIAFFLEAAHMSGDRTWADDAAGILVGCGYFDQHSAAIISLLNSLIGLVDADNGVDGWIQDSAYAVLAFNTVGGAARPYANSLGRWLARLQGINGGWIEPDGYEYPEGEGEAVRALSSTIGANITLDGFEPGAVVKSSWRRSINNGKAAKPFNGN
jgi:hypothetical protein